MVRRVHRRSKRILHLRAGLGCRAGGDREKRAQDQSCRQQVPPETPKIRPAVKVVIFLQNAWSPIYAGRVWPRKSWLRALALSRSGQRLACLTDDWNECENTTLMVGRH